MEIYFNKKCVSEDEKLLKVYELYLQRITTEYNLIWNRFKIYLSLNGGIVAILGFLVGTKKEDVELNAHLGNISAFIYLISTLGLVFSISWLLVNKDGQKWQKLMNETLAQYENKLLLNNGMGLYTKIEEQWKGNNKFGFDVLQINNLIPCFLILSWVIILIWNFLIN